MTTYYNLYDNYGKVIETPDKDTAKTIKKV